MATIQSSNLTRVPWATYLLTLGQAINLTVAVISVTIAALVGAKLASTAALGTVPYGTQFFAVMLFTYPVSMLMRRYGRRIMFAIGSIFLIIAGMLGYYSIDKGNFSLLILSHALIGIYISCANFYRFAAVDNIAQELKAKAISLIVAGGVLAAIAGPFIASLLRNFDGYKEFSLCYTAFSLFGAFSIALMIIWKPLNPGISLAEKFNPANQIGVRRWNMFVVTAVFSSASGYFMMNLLMVQSSLVMKNICTFDTISRAIQAHVLAMFIPSFFINSLINKIGLRKVLISGFSMLLTAAGLGMLDVNYNIFPISLILVGLGWNLVYLGGGTVLVHNVLDQDRHYWQGINDTAIAGCATLGAFLPAPLLAGLGWNGTNIMILPLCLIGMSLCWNTLQKRDPSC
ncbi:MFS transporter [Rugamonas sp. DEMB1]|uniref:MFS transporter n=1 Tax=Rugamonas sp. DEMB1 TaxID=3039386 RepID=UPI002447F238|nr:MFS transporter [Rugamonas sp. DEMB1]WGG52873.1 MFS transporter [Rugamonas sp. DEMB1]